MTAMDAASRAAYFNQIQALIAKYGWAVQGVGAEKPLTYTVGLTEAALPELVIVGLPMDLGKMALNAAARQHCGAELEPGALIDAELSVQFKVAPIEQRDAWAYLNVANAMYDERLQALQLLWPDAGGNWPGDADWSLGDAQALG